MCQAIGSEDSIEHHAYCREVKQLAARRLRLDPIRHVNLHTFTCTNPAICTKELLTRAALLIYATYRALNHQREATAPLQGEALYHALCQWLIEGVRGHTTSSQILAATWTTQEHHDLTTMTERENNTTHQRHTRRQ